MKHQQVSVDYWAMGKAMLTYGAITALVWLMLRLFSAVFTLPRRLRAQHENMEATLKELQKRYPDLNITEEDLLNAEKELEAITKEDFNFDNKEKDTQELKEDSEKDKDEKAGKDKDEEQKPEDKKTI